MQRNQMIGLIHVGKSKLGLDDATYRDLLERVGGARSCTAMDDAALERVVHYLRDKGAVKANHKAQKPKFATSKKSLTDKIEAQLTHLGKPWSYGEGIAKNMFAKKLNFCDRDELHRIVAALEYAIKRYDKKEKARATQ